MDDGDVRHKNPSAETPKAAINLSKTVALVGLMGAGKSAVGRRLAARWKCDFVDADNAIEDAAGCTIAEFFERHGEDEFRRGEERVIARLLAGRPIVLATGGGAYMSRLTRESLRQQAITLWLRADIDVLFERVSRRTHRPLLKTADPRATLQDLMAVRYPLYAHADLVVDSDHGSIEQTVERANAAVQIYLQQPSEQGE